MKLIRKELMKIIHTSDWHLGTKNFWYNYREEEHQMARLADGHHNQRASQLPDRCRRHFRHRQPPNYARRDVLPFSPSLWVLPAAMSSSPGQPRFPAMLNAPKVLQALNIHVIGEGSENPEEEVIEGGKKGNW